MNNKLLALFLLILLPFVVFATDSSELESSIVDELEQADTVSVVVVLEDNAEITRDSNELAITDDVWHTSDAVLDSDDVDITHEYNAALNGFAAEVTEEGLAQLQESNSVEHIYYDSTYTLNLGDSVPQVNASDVHAIQLKGTPLNGQGQTVCVIDTGINYNHEDLGSCFGDNNVSSTCKVIGGEDLYNSDMDPLDDNGHGTHVAGIVAADGTVAGVAPGANLIAMKVFGADGYSTNASMILAGIDWCVSNSSKFNISIITMSLSQADGFGGERIFSSESACDADGLNGGVVSAVNYAAAQGILVTVAAGNDGSTSGIGLPACASNATSVGAVNDSNDIFYNRQSILDLLAPGRSIQSTDEIGDGYATSSGTSMSAPHVAGAGAILQQYAQDYEDRTLTPAEIEQTLIDYGTLINDTLGTELNYPLINVYSALFSLDTVGPEIVVSVPNGSSISMNETLQISVSDLNVVSYVWYEHGADTLEPYSNGTDWFIDANWSAGEQQIDIYANDSQNQVSVVNLVLILGSEPTINDWLWSTSTNDSDSLDIVVNESDTLQMLVNASDVDGDSLEYTWFLRSLEINNTQNMSYDVALNDSGNTTLELIVSDGYSNASNIWSILIVDPAPPSISAIPNQNHNESAWEFNISSYITNPDGDELIYSVSSEFSISSLAIITKTFDCDDSGDHTVVATVSDGYNSVSDSFDVSISDSCVGSSDTSDDDDDDDDSSSSDSSDDDTLASLVAEASAATSAATSSTSSNGTTETTKVTKKVVPKKKSNETTNETQTFATTSEKPFSLAILGNLIDNFEYNNMDMKYKQIIAISVCGSLVAAYMYPHYHKKRSRKTLKVKLHHGYEKNWRK
jgi:subtilisin family serine protease